MRGERDLPEGHPSASDYVAGSPAAKRYAKRMLDTASNRDWPKGHAAAADNPNRVEPTHPLDSTRDFSRPHTIVENPAAVEVAEEA